MDLATLDEVKEWLRSNAVAFGNTDDTILRALITRVSSVILGMTSRPNLLPHTVTEIVSGVGSRGLLLREWPVLSITSIEVGSVTVPASASLVDYGYTLEAWDGMLPGSPQALTLRGYSFERGMQNCRIIYGAGYKITDETVTVASGAATVDAPRGPWASDGGVKIASSGVSLVRVSGTPADGEYALHATPGRYTFNAAQDGAEMQISYGFIPAALNQACIETVGERYSYRTRIGQQSRSQGGQETVSFSLASMQEFVKMAIQPYVKVTP